MSIYFQITSEDVKGVRLLLLYLKWFIWLQIPKEI